MNILIIDNFDSFTFNLYQFIGEVLESAQRQGEIERFTVKVIRNNEYSLADIEAMQADRIIISPGPGSPEDPNYFGVCADVIKHLGKHTPLLGVCLGMQGIVHSFGGDITNAPVPMHGKISPIQHDGTGVFSNLPNQLEVMRYHSLIANAATLPDCLRANAAVGALSASQFDDPGALKAAGDFEVMGIEHRQYPIYGIQFHPESFATEGGKDLIHNFLLAHS